MSNIFNKYGNVKENPTLDEYKLTIEDMVKDYLEHAQEIGATIVELRALEAHLMSVVSCAFAENRLRTQIAQRKKERQEGKAKHKNYYACTRCGEYWETIEYASTYPNSGTCPECTAGNTPYKVENYWE